MKKVSNKDGVLVQRNSEELDFSDVIQIIQMHKNNAYRKINEELVTMYYEIGEHLSQKLKNERWGNKAIEKLLLVIKKEFPEMKNLSKRGLYRCIQFYETYHNYSIVSPLVSQISWTNNLLIFSRESSIEEKEFYIRLCIKNNYSKRELQRQIESHYYQRYLMSNGDAFESLEPVIGEEDGPNTRILDQYSLEFLDLPNNYKEKDLKDSIMNNLKDFILEIGNDFTFIDKEHRITVGGEDFYIDLLFYNRAYSCLVAFELKVDKFKPDYVSKMDFYLAALDKYEKKENENPSVGIVLCASKNDSVVELATSRSISPTAIATYSTQLIDTKALQKKLIEYQEFFDKETM